MQKKDPCPLYPQNSFGKDCGAELEQSEWPDAYCNSCKQYVKSGLIHNPN